MELDNRVPWAQTIWLPLIAASGELGVTVIAKASLNAAAQGTATAATAPVPIAMCDIHAPGDNGMLCTPSDLCDYKPGTDVVVVAPPDPKVNEALRRRTVAIGIGPISVRHRAGRGNGVFPLRRDHPSRLPLAGTYDAAWLEQRMPLLPEDFDPRFHQAAPSDLVAVPWLRGGESVTVEGLYDAPAAWHTVLPPVRLVLCGHVLNRYFSLPMRLDTVLIDAIQPRLTMVWRASLRPLRKVEDVKALFLYAVRPQIAREVFGME
ncbi:hypothetical protein GCM10007320_64420 [Pseudorhodoferax aquiterrae]|uniref:DUF2169 domain-containing protein n=1 Tax=Pseudorhodoferax aquiterrae TaxID=747304 RepID=A0ABQ3GEZ1_9BURK|nr:DUF2169 domain-containing protein [Pseudorhodoferax aquiterrae]GHD03932.1 hypothetical protein GCM10007320_64420 [Pseudorhodoferax aquiterrae]